MSRLQDFFHGDDTQFGIFYPNHYILAAFLNLTDAYNAKDRLRQAGHVEEDVIAVSGEEVVQFAEDHWLNDGLWGTLVSSISRLIGTEVVYADKDLAAAKDGAAFVAVFCPTDPLKMKAWKVLEPLHPLAARFYQFGGIEHLTGEGEN